MKIALLNPRTAIGAVGFQATRKVWKKVKYPFYFIYVAR